MLYFQLHQSQGASEKFHGAVIDHYGGDDTRVFKEVTEVGEALEALKEVCSSQMKWARAVAGINNTARPAASRVKRLMAGL